MLFASCVPHSHLHDGNLIPEERDGNIALDKPYLSGEPQILQRMLITSKRKPQRQLFMFLRGGNISLKKMERLRQAFVLKSYIFIENGDGAFLYKESLGTHDKFT